MPDYDVFISHSVRDKTTADATCAILEGHGIRCWVAPRDIMPGMEWGEAIVNAITETGLMVLVFSSHANESPQVRREVERAVSKGKPIIPLRIEDVAPTASMEYYLSAPHWLDALTPPLEQHLKSLAQTVSVFLGREAKAPAQEAPPTAPETQKAAPVALPRGWTHETRLVKVAAPEGTHERDITFHKNSIGMELVLIPAGEFMMGSPPTEEGRQEEEGPQHPVRITKPFYMGAYQVTQAEYEKVMGSNPAHFKGARNPVERVSWDDAVQFCKRLSQTDGGTYRLPTEAEWEYACRAGTTTPFYFGNAISAEQACCWGQTTMPVGGFPANAHGLCDMHGNVLEWCRDWYDGDYYGTSPRDDPSGPPNGSSRVLRGGSWNNKPRYCRSAGRFRVTSVYRSGVGFRVVCVGAPRP